MKSIVSNPCKSANHTFTKFVTNAIGDAYIDPGTYNKSLRSSTPINRPNSAKVTPFKSSHPNNRTVKKSEFEYKESDEPKGHQSMTAFVNRPGGFYNKKTSEPFSTFSTIGYQEDPYERKQDFARDEYARLNSKIAY